MFIDMRSDFIARTTPEMIQSMIAAATVRPGFESREDATVRELEGLAADLLGFEDSLFCPTCMMANQIVINLRCQSGEVFITEPSSHVMTSELNAASILTGAVPKLIDATRGEFDLGAVRASLCRLKQEGIKIGVLLIENSHVRSGGAVVKIDHMSAIYEITQKFGVPVHLDGARIFNAATALGLKARDLASNCDTLAFSLNKGLGAPLGAILAGSRNFIRRAVYVRQMFGGGWRPATIPAAAGIVALNTMIDRISEDHDRARALALGLNDLNGIEVDPALVETNIVLIKPTSQSPKTLAKGLSKIGLETLPFGNFLRLVTHHEISDLQVEQALEAFRQVLSGDKNDT